MNEGIIGPSSFSFKGINWKKFGIGALVAISGTLLTYLTTWITGQDFGTYTPIIVGIWTIVSNLIRKWVSHQE